VAPGRGDFAPPPPRQPRQQESPLGAGLLMKSDFSAMQRNAARASGRLVDTERRRIQDSEGVAAPGKLGESSDQSAMQRLAGIRRRLRKGEGEKRTANLNDVADSIAASRRARREAREGKENPWISLADRRGRKKGRGSTKEGDLESRDSKASTKTRNSVEKPDLSSGSDGSAKKQKVKF
jgi:hypothetical protein